MRWWYWILIAAAVYGFGEQAVNATVDFVTRGRRLTTTQRIDGIVRGTPEALAAEAGGTVGREVSVDAYALARMVRSEAGDGAGPTERIAIAWVALNDAAALGWTLFSTLTFNKNRPARTFGEQRGGRYATSRDPYENDLAVAEAVLLGEASDPTGGARKFVHRGAFGLQEGTRTYQETVDRWAADGYRPVELDGVGDLVVFRKGVA